MNGLYRSRGAFWNGGYRMISHRPQDSVLGFHRDDGQGDRLAVLFNFSPMGFYQYDFPLDPESGGIREAREVFNTDGVQYGGTGQFRNVFAYIVRSNQGTATHLRVSMPPLSVSSLMKNERKDAEPQRRGGRKKTNLLLCIFS